MSRETKQRRVVCAAIRAEDGELLLGIRHYSHDMHLQMRARTDGEKFHHRGDKDQGFVDQHGTWLSREEAFKVAVRTLTRTTPNDDHGRTAQQVDDRDERSELAARR